MLWKAVLLLTVVPLVELYLLVKITELTSFGFTVGLIILTGLVGATLARIQGLLVVNRMRRELARAELPRDSILDGIMILVAAALLVTPGVLTDAFGFLLLIPWTRAVIRKLVKGWIGRRLKEGTVRIHKQMGFGPIRDEPPPENRGTDEEENE